MTLRRRWLVRSLQMVMSVPIVATAQEPSSNLGLPAIAAIGIHGGFARLERSSKGEEAGLLVDLGWLRGRSMRLQAEVSLLGASLTEYVELEDSTFQGDYFDLSAGVSSVWLASAEAKVSPYILAGFAVHALSSAFGTVSLDQRYNANRFGSHIGTGLRLRFGASRQAVFVEVRRVISDEVDRTAVRFGGLVLMGDLFRRHSTIR